MPFTPLRLCWLALALLAAPPSFAQQVFVESFGTDSGLPQSNVTDVAQTRDSYLWIGTEGGLARFDGVRFVTFRTSTTPALDSDSIRCLYEDRTGALWIGTDSGIIRHRDGRFEKIGLKGVSVRAIAQDPAGRIWIGTYGEGLYLWDGAALARADRPGDLPTPRIACLCADPRGRLWIGTEWTNGPVCLENGRFRRDPALRGIQGRITAMYADPNGTLWFGAYHHALYRFQDGRLSQFLNAPGLAIGDIRPVGDGLWIAAGDLFKADDRNRPDFTAVAHIPSDEIRALCEDREGGIWLGCGRGDGLILARPIPYRSISTEDGLPGNGVRTVSGDPAGNLWLTILNCPVTRIAPDGRIKTYGPADGFPAGEASVVYATSDGRIWAGINGRLFQWKDGVGRSYPNIASVYGLYEDRRHDLWIGTRNQGVWRVTAGTSEPISVWPEIRYATSFDEAADGTFYIGTWEMGIFKIKGGKITVLDRANGLPENEVRAVYLDRQGLLWAGLKGRGLAVLSGGRWLNPSLLSEAVADHVSAIAEDDYGELWLGTAAGVMHAPRDAILAAARGTGALPKMRVTVTRDGFHTDAAWSGTQPGVWATARHTLLFATRQGLIEVDPAHLPANPVPPPVQIESVELDGRPVDFASAVQLPAGTRNVAVAYTALSFVQPARVLFQYRLEGYDSGWIDAANRRVASYAHLPPGRYVFRVKACNSDGVWNERDAELAFVQRPYFHQTGWFKTLLIGGLLGAIWVTNRWSHRRLTLKAERLEEKQATEKERNRIAKNLHDDLGANLTALSLLAERIGRAVEGPGLGDDVEQLRRRVRALAEALDAVVWTVNPANDSLDRLVPYICGVFQDLFCLAGIRSRLEVQPEIPPWPLTPEERSHLFLVSKEAMHNVIKHADATEVWLRIRRDAGVFSLTIEDNGRGFDPAGPGRAGRRNGLANMRSHVTELGGTLEIGSSPGHGTTVRIAFPLRGR